MKSIKDLLEQEADLHADEDGALRSAAAYGRLKVIKYLLGQGADLQVWDDRPFRKAAEFGHPEAAKRSAEQGADLHAWNDYSLRFAAKNGHLEVVKYLLEQGANSNLVSEQMLIKLFLRSSDHQKYSSFNIFTSEIDLVKKSYQISRRNEILSTYKKKCSHR